MDPSPSPKPAGQKLAPLRPLAALSPAGQPSVDAARPAAARERPALVSLSWERQDVENRLGIFKAGRYTSVNRVLASVAAVICTVAFFGLMTLCFNSGNALLKRLGRFLCVPPTSMRLCLPLFSSSSGFRL